MFSTKAIIGIIVGIVFVGGATYVVVKNPKDAVLDSNQTVGTQQEVTDSSSGPSTTIISKENEREDDGDDENEGGTKTTITTSSDTTTTGTTGTTYTLAQVATHKTASDCWTTISGSVYDLTKWIGQHPGGEGAILSICGKDGTGAFTGQHGMGGKEASILAGFKIGVLK